MMLFMSLLAFAIALLSLFSQSLKLIKRLCPVWKMKVLTSHDLKKSKTKPMKHLKHTNIFRLFTKAADSAKKGYVGIHSSGFRDFLPKPELLRSIVDSGFKHPFEGYGFWGKWSYSMFPLQRLHKSFHEVH